jgi:DNA-binding response OmpR family regulator
MPGKGKSRKEPRGPTTITLLSSDPDAGEVLARVLESTGNEVRRAFGEDAAVTAVTADVPGLAVIDVGGGASNPGLRIVEELRSHPNEAVRSVRVILISDQARGQGLAWSAGVDGYLDRPVEATDVTATVNNVLSRSEKERATFRAEVQKTLR